MRARSVLRTFPALNGRASRFWVPLGFYPFSGTRRSFCNVAFLHMYHFRVMGAIRTGKVTKRNQKSRTYDATSFGYRARINKRTLFLHVHRNPGPPKILEGTKLSFGERNSTKLNETLPVSLCFCNETATFPLASINIITPQTDVSFGFVRLRSDSL